MSPAAGGDWDLVALGEVMLRMAPPRFERLRTARRLDVVVAGAQFNVCADLARLGRSTTFLTQLPASDLGLLAADACRAHGVDLSHARTIPGARMGLNFLEFALAPRAPINVFDRQGSAASRIDEASFDWAAALRGSRYAHTDGILPGIGPGTLAAARTFLREARAQGARTTFDLNYRAHVWRLEDARAAWADLLTLVDIVVVNPAVTATVFGFEGDDEAVARYYADRFGCRTVLVTRREIDGGLHGTWRSLALHDGEIAAGRPASFEVVDRFGTGDAFLAGFLHAHVAHDLEFSLSFANAACALAHTIEGDVLQADHEEVLAIMNGDVDLRVRR